MAATTAYGIITQTPNASSPIRFEDDKTHPLRHARKINSSLTRSMNWKSILRDATFQSLIKHTGFTPSLEEKMESDRLLWEKIQKAKFLRKNSGKNDDGNEQMRMGVLLDMTSDGGSLEFRQSDRSVYKCPDNKCDEILKRLLAIWKIERFEPNDVWVKVKIPKQNQDEDVYEFTPKHGLQQMNGRFSPNATMTSTTTSPTNDPTHTIDDDGVSTERPVIDERFAIERRADHGTTTPRLEAKVFPGSFESRKRNITQTISNKPILEGRRAKIERQINVRVNRTNNVMINAPFNYNPRKAKAVKMTPDQLIDLDRAERASASEPIVSKGITEVDRIDYGFGGSRRMSFYDNKQGKVKDYPGSKVELIKYNPYLTPKRPQTTLHFPTNIVTPTPPYLQVLPLKPDFVQVVPNVLKEFQTNGRLYDGFLPSLGPTGSPFTTTVNYALHFAESYPSYTEYETTINHDEGKSIHFKGSPLFTQYSELDPIYHGDGKGFIFVGEEEKPTTTASVEVSSEEENDTSTENVTEQERLEKSRNSTMKDNLKLNNFSVDSTEQSSYHVSKFADAKGNEITVAPKSSLKRPITTPKTGMKSILKHSSVEVSDYAPLYMKWGERLGRKTTAKPSTTSPVPETTTTTMATLATDSNKTNMIIDNLQDKTPEEIVNTLTNMGVVNTTRIEGYPPVSEKTLETSSKILEKIHKEGKTSNSDPISLIVNRISQSYSYRTAKGKVKNFKKMRA